MVSAYLIFRLFTVLGNYQSEYKALQEELKKKEELDISISELKALCSDESKEKLIEKAARERFGFAYPNEEFYIDSSGN